MGADLADLNNDGLPELFVTEMLPATERRYKTKAAFEGWNRYQLYRDQGYHQQFSRNVLQLNRGGGNFSEVGRMAGVEATDWSWGALLCDLDNDGLRDIFVATGTGKDLLDQDYINFNASPEAIRRMIFQEGKGITDVIDQIPSEALSNAVFRNRGDMTFEDVAATWGLDQAGFSNGSAYADLDNDGDLDLVVNNVNGIAGIYRNNSVDPSVMIHLKARIPGNPDAIGASLTAMGPAGRISSELYPMRGFQSTVDKRLHLPGRPLAVQVRWPDGRTESFDLSGDTAVVEVVQGSGYSELPDSAGQGVRPGLLHAVLTEVRDQSGPVIHREDAPVDFDRDPLLFIGINNEGPALAVADLNGDGVSDFYLGGAAGFPGQLLLGNTNGSYTSIVNEVLAADAGSENVGAAFFDADGDGDSDLYVANGSNAFGPGSTALLDQLYINEGNNRWRRGPQLLPDARRPVVSSCVRPRDVDGDGDTDLFVGGRLRPGVYGVPTDSYLLLNDGTGKFSATVLPQLGMVTDAAWLDTDGDGRPGTCSGCGVGTHPLPSPRRDGQAHPDRHGRRHRRPVECPGRGGF